MKGALAQASADVTELKSEMLAELGSLTSVSQMEVKNIGKFTIPGVCMVMTRKKPATKGDVRQGRRCEDKADQDRGEGLRGSGADRRRLRVARRLRSRWSCGRPTGASERNIAASCAL